MDAKTVALIAMATALIGSVAGPRVLAQAAQSQGQWQMVAGSGGDGGTAWKFNTETGQSFFCYRQNCFPSATGPAPVRQ